MVREPVPVIAVACGRPGLGGSVVSALVALAAMAQGARVLWLEAYAPEGGPETLAARVASAGAHDLVVVDAGSRMHGIAAACTLSTECTLLLVVGDARADLAASFAVAKFASNLAYPPALSVVSNRVDPTSGTWAANALANACARFLDRAMAVVGHVPDDPTLAAALAAGMPIADAAHGSPASEAAALLIESLLAPPRFSSFLPAGQ